MQGDAAGFPGVGIKGEVSPHCPRLSLALGSGGESARQSDADRMSVERRAAFVNTTHGVMREA